MCARIAFYTHFSLAIFINHAFCPKPWAGWVHIQHFGFCCPKLEDILMLDYFVIRYLTIYYPIVMDNFQDSMVQKYFFITSSIATVGALFFELSFLTSVDMSMFYKNDECKNKSDSSYTIILTSIIWWGKAIASS